MSSDNKKKYPYSTYNDYPAYGSGPFFDTRLLIQDKEKFNIEIKNNRIISKKSKQNVN